MQTLLSKASDDIINMACSLLKNGEVVAVPTETVYGLAADATNKEAIEKVFKAKGRPSDNPLIVHISDFKMLKKIVSEFSEDAQKLAAAFWPGPLTIIMPKSDYICKETSGGLGSVGVRMPANKIALEIISKSQIAFAAPSANISGKPSPTSAQDVYDDMQGKIPLIINGGQCEKGVESTVISVLNKTPIILRPGVITKEDIEQVLGKEVLIAKEITEETAPETKVLSPGMKYKHYSPNAEVYLVKGRLKQFADFVNSKTEKNIFAMCFDGEEKELKINSVCYGKEFDGESQAQNLFKILRQLDRQNASKIYVRCPKTTGVSLAVYNRLLRSAGFKIIDLNAEK